MKKKWNEEIATSLLKSNGAEIKSKFILVKNGLNGLSACSALDYLKNHCGYKVSLHTVKN